MGKSIRAVLLAMVLSWIGFGPVHAALVVDSAAVNPNSTAAGVATDVVVTALISDSTVLADSVNLQRLDAAGRVIEVLGYLVDDGKNGDQTAGDKIFTMRLTIFETVPGPVRLRVSAAFRGRLLRAFSTPMTVNVTGGATGIAILSPANLAYLNTSPISVSGTVGDRSAQVTVNGINSPVNSTSGNFQLTVPLVEGNNTLTAVARNTGGTTSTSSIQVTLDTTPPRVTVESPANNLVTTDATVTAAGTVNDVVVGTVNTQQAQVRVNGVLAQVANRSFTSVGIPLVLGVNTLQAVAVDQTGNSATTSIQITRVPATIPSIRIISGNNQSGPISNALPAPLVVTLQDGAGNPAPNRIVVFRVKDNNGSVSSGTLTAAAVAVNSNAQGQAEVFFTLGSRAGAGSNRVEATSAGFEGTAAFMASGVPTTAALITVDSGNNQTGALGEKLALPFVVVVADAGFNRIGGVPVTFTVKKGGGSFNGQSSLTMNTDPDGRAVAVLALGTQPGVDNNVVEANFPGNALLPATFVASGKPPGSAADTRISGVVLDNSNNPIAGVTLRLFLTNQGINNNTPQPLGTPVQTDAHGAFLMQQTPVGFFKLMADGTTVASTRGVFPTLEYDIVTVAGQNNTVGMPIYLPVLDTINQVCVNETTGGTLTLPTVPGFSLTVAPGSATFPGASRTGCVTVSMVNGDKVPMSPGFGQQPRFIVTIQPAGTIFNPPAPITMPNVDGLQPGQVTELYSYDHDLSAFTAIGTATASADGMTLRSDPGVGIIKAGWHCGGNPNQNGNVGSLSVTLSAAPNPANVGSTVDLTAKGSPPVDGIYENWEIIDDPADPFDDPSAGQLIATPSCPNQPTCIGKIKGIKLGVVTVRVHFRCLTTNATAVSNLVKIDFTVLMQLKDVTFLQDHSVVRDRHALFDAVTDPVWKSVNNSAQNGEVAYTRNKKLQVSASFEINPPLLSTVTGVTVEAIIPGLGVVRRTNQTLSGNSYSFPATDSDNNLPNSTRFFNPMTFNWKVRQDGSNHADSVGTSENKVYVTLADPRPYALVSSSIPVTLLKLAIQFDGATDQAGAVQKTWQSFAGPTNVTTWDGRKMYYYKDGVGFNSCSLTFQPLITTDPESGQCGSFTELLMGALAVNDVQADWITIEALDGDQLIVKNWLFAAPSYPTQPEYKWKLEVNSSPVDDPMVPPLPGDQFGDLTNVDGLAGQNSLRPSEKIFERHFMVRTLGHYYDPSYGVTWADPQDFETNALEGYAADFADGTRIDGTHVYQLLRAKKVGGPVNVHFVVENSN